FTIISESNGIFYVLFGMHEFAHLIKNVPLRTSIIQIKWKSEVFEDKLRLFEVEQDIFGACMTGLMKYDMNQKKLQLFNLKLHYIFPMDLSQSSDPFLEIELRDVKQINFDAGDQTIDSKYHKSSKIGLNNILRAASWSLDAPNANKSDGSIKSDVKKSTVKNNCTLLAEYDEEKFEFPLALFELFDLCIVVRAYDHDKLTRNDFIGSGFAAYKTHNELWVNIFTNVNQSFPINVTLLRP
ncbi:MAG: hypothetical protein MHMPM18_003605, partial [Marteilia pararefringens]